MARLLYATFDPVPAPKGASRHVQALVAGLVAAGHDVTLAAIGPGGEVAGAHALPFRPPPGDFLSQALAFGDHVVAVAAGFDAWHARDIWGGYPLARRGGTPLIAEINGLPSIELPYRFPALLRHPETHAKVRAQEDAFLAAARGVLTPSSVTAAYLQARGVAPERVVVVPNGVDLAAFDHAEPPVRGWPEVLYIGTFSPWQGLETLLQAFTRVPPPTRLRLIGPDGLWGGALRARAAGLGLADRVVFMPPVAPERMPALIRAATVAVAPLDGGPRNVEQGCCPIKLLEYMAAARPIVASALPVVEHLVTHGREALLVPPDDPAALAVALTRLLSNPVEARALGDAAHARARHYGWDASNQAVLAAYARWEISPA
ncbi:MAG: mshA1 [Cyanobacteria bacterium RYN_339]|nr:mshA1 [Cyanobacteria bacterium RYN_339]